MTTIQELKAANETIQSMSSQVSTLKTNLQSELAAAAEAILAKENQIATLTATIAAAQAEIKTISEKLTKAEAKPVEIMAALGVPPVAVSAAGNAQPETKDELWAQYAKLTDPKARVEFYRKHKILHP